jgi:hypothetical protein
VLTVRWIEGKAVAVRSAMRIGGGGERSSRLGSREGCAGLLDASDRRGVLLRRRWGGQLGPIKAGGKKL